MARLPLIAIVDDDASARAAVAALVEAMGFPARCFAGAADFLRSDAVRSAEAVIADQRMPGMSGLALCLALRARREPIRTVLMTAYPDAATERHARDAGIDGYLAKPCDPEALFTCLSGTANAVGGSGPRGADLPEGSG
jgi:FixJ family two-component response regulator